MLKNHWRHEKQIRKKEKLPNNRPSYSLTTENMPSFHIKFAGEFAVWPMATVGHEWKEKTSNAHLNSN